MAEVEGQLDALHRAGLSADAVSLQGLQSQLKGLQSLRNSVDSASPSALASLRQAVATSVAASHAAAQQAANELNASLSQAAYQQATAELDRRVAATMAEDKRHNDEAHARAERLGIDLSDADRERQRLEKQRADAIARGDKVAERQADLAIAENTERTMRVTGASQDDLDAQQRIITVRREALAEQSRLRGEKVAGEQNSQELIAELSGDKISQAAQRTEQLGGADTSEATRLQLETEIRRTVSEAPRDVTPHTNVEAALTPEAKEAARKAMKAVTVNLDGFSLDDITPLASAEPTTQTVRGMPVPASQGLA